MKSFLSTLVVVLAATSLEAAPADNEHGELVVRGFRDERCGFWYGSCSPGLCCNIWGYCGSTSDYCSIGCQKIYGRCDDGRKPTTTTKKPTPTPTPTPLKKMNEQCGSRHGTCESGLCCSDWGRCGNSFLHCYVGCQKKYGDCGDKKKTTTTSSTMKPTQTTKSSSTTTTTTSSSTKNSSTATSTTASSTTETSTTASSTTETSTTASSTTETSTTASSTTETSTTVSTTAAASSVSTTPSTTTTTSAPTSTPVKLKYLDEQCGPSAGTCAPGLCCSEWGWCGYTSDHCTGGCQKDFGSCNDKKEAEVITRCTAPGTFAVTFDDGPSVLTSGLLDYLDRVNVKATFFVNGLNEKNVDTGNPILSIYDLADVVRRAYLSGHQICSHTWAHTDIITVYEDEVVYEMSRLNHAFSKILGKVPTCMRPPYGDTDGPSRQILQKMGYTVVTWNMDPVDWNPANSIDEMYQEYVDQTGPTNPQVGKFISLNHDVWNTTADFRPFNYPKTIPLAERSIEYLLSRGWKLVNLADCLESPPFYREPNPSDNSCGEDECV